MTISVIIPTLNEESCLPEALDRLRRQNAQEIIVVDGGSSDATCALARPVARMFHAPRGRAFQMNVGAAHARGDVLLFLHADCWLDDGALEDAERLLAGRHTAAGCFTMTVGETGLLYRLIERCATGRVRLTGMVYGDQGLFVRRDLFERLGGFPQIRLMEDLFFSRALRRHGRIAVSTRRIHVSPRRWQRTGLVRQTICNWTLTALTAGGISPDALARFYSAVR